MLLTADRGLLHRATGFTPGGITKLFDVAGSFWRATDSWLSIPEQFEHQGIDTIHMPLHEDGKDYYEILKNFVHGYLSQVYNYAHNGCGADREISAWYTKVNSMM